MRLSNLITLPAVFLCAGALALVAAYFSSIAIEDSSKSAIRSELDKDAITWATVDANGLQIFLAGTAPNEAARFQAMSAAGRVVDTARVLDQINVEQSADLVAPRFSIELLRNEAGLSLIGLIPEETDRANLLATIGRKVGSDVPVSDFLNGARFEAPETWQDALEYSVDALGRLPRSKISVAADEIKITAMTESAAARTKLETDLLRRKPDGVRVILDLTAPRPVITPFTLRFVLDEDGPRFDACSASSEASRKRILDAAVAAGLAGKIDCTIGLGVPSKNWPDAAELAIAAVAELGAGSVTFSDADISLIAMEGTDQTLFDNVIGELDRALPDVFALTAVLPVAPEDTKDRGPAEFTATLSPEGSVQLRGRINSEVARVTADSFARARFGSAAVHTAARIDETLTPAWAVRVLAGLDALAQLSNGAVIVSPTEVAVRGNTGNTDASAMIAKLLADKLGEGAEFTIDVTYQEKLDPLLAIPTPEQCEEQIVQIIGSRKISFEPGAATFDAAAAAILDDLSELLTTCGDIPLEISGHTDSQGREIMNQELSQARAQAVLSALRERRVLTASYTAVGYGETQPIADNGTEEGREANRRIEFKLIRPEPVPEEETTLDSVAETPQDQDAPATETSDNEQN